jgi:hypothetical protein
MLVRESTVLAHHDAGGDETDWGLNFGAVPLVLIVVPERKNDLGFLDFVFATEARCRFWGFSMLQTFVITFVGAGIPSLRISAPGSPMPSRSRSSGGMRLVPETNTQKLSVPGLYYKTFAGTKPAPLERNLAHV